MCFWKEVKKLIIFSIFINNIICGVKLSQYYGIRAETNK
jgi:hypothetical protein